MSKKIVVPPNEDPIEYFQRYRRKAVWQKPDYWKGVRWGAGGLVVLAIILKFAGVW